MRREGDEHEVQAIERRSRLYNAILAGAAIVGIACGVVGSVGGIIGAREANEARGELRTYVQRSTAEVQLRLYKSCVTGNQETRPAARVTAVVLRDLVARVGDLVPGATLPPEFRTAPPKLTSALRKLEARDCSMLYPQGRVLFLRERGR